MRSRNSRREEPLDGYARDDHEPRMASSIEAWGRGQFPLEWLHNTPFSDYTIPALVLRLSSEEFAHSRSDGIHRPRSGRAHICGGGTDHGRLDRRQR